MRVQDVMTQDVQTVEAGIPAGEAWTLMGQQRIRHLVVTEGKKVLGVISDGDLGGPKGSAVRRNRTVGELMSPRVVEVRPSTTIRQAANLMRGRSIGSLVVTKAGRVVGIVTVSDLLELIGRGSERPVAATTRWTLKHIAPHRPRHQSTGSW